MPHSAPVQEWLLDSAQPAVRFLTLTEILGRSQSDPQVKEARKKIPSTGWAADILAERGEGGTWGDPKSLYVPKYNSDELEASGPRGPWPYARERTDP